MMKSLMVFFLVFNDLIREQPFINSKFWEHDSVTFDTNETWMDSKQVYYRFIIVYTNFIRKI